MGIEAKSLSRFTAAQANGVYERALSEIRAGCKQSHWMWFIFPQIEGLGYSSTAQFYGIQGMQEARGYLSDSILGMRLREICAALLELETSDPLEIFDSPDNLKLRSSMTMFALAAPNEPLFPAVLQKFYNDERCHRTEQKLSPIGEYIAAQDHGIQPLLEDVYGAIKAVLPNAVEKLSYQMPTFWQGRNLIHFAAQKNHLGVYPGAEAVLHYAQKLTEYKTSKGAIQFPYKTFGAEQLVLIAEIAAWCCAAYVK